MTNETEQVLETQITHVETTPIESMERAVIDMQVATAKKYPRPPLSRIRDNMMSFVTLDEETAASCFFTLPRGGKAIQGESIRMAEIAASQYQNVRISTRIIDMVTVGDNPHVVVQGVAFDLEKNFASSMEKRRRIIKKKFKETIDEDDINLAVNACSAIAYRDATFKIIPKALIKTVFEAAKKVAIGDIRSLANKRMEVIDRLKKMGATEERILAVIEARRIEDVDIERLQVLIGLGTALKDGETTLEDAFPVIEKTESLGAESVKAKLGRPKGIKNKTKTSESTELPPSVEIPDPEFQKRQKEQIKKLKQTRSKPGKYVCNACGVAFDEPDKNGLNEDVCPDCGSDNFAETKAKPVEAEFQFVCHKCGRTFDEPKRNGKGQAQCPHCLSLDLTSDIKE